MSQCISLKFEVTLGANTLLLQISC